jgi:diphthamide synthase (EF-2-diphthine--ammonia ligase)
VVSANAKWFDAADVGAAIDQSWLNKLPKEVDPCGENGEFHTFCYNGPIFNKAVEFKKGKAVLKSYPDPSDSNKTIDFWFADLKAVDAY